MNQRAAGELLDCIMHDDFVKRRDSLNAWSRRWITTIHVEFTHDGQYPDAAVWPVAKESMTRAILNGLTADAAHVLLWGKLAESPTTFACEMHAIMQEPKP